MALLKQMVRGPGAEHTGADHRDMILHRALVGRCHGGGYGSSCSGEREQLAWRRRSHRHTVIGEESMRHDLRLLLKAIALETPAGLQLVRVAAERVAHQRKVKAALGLRLPHVRHLM